MRFFVARAPHVRTRLEEAGWSSTTRWDWDLYWRPQVPSLAAYASLRPGMRINHIPGIGALTSRRRLQRTLVEAGAEHVLSGGDDDDDDDDDDTVSESFSFLVLVSGVDPLRVYVHTPETSTAVERESQPIIRRTVFAARDAMTRHVRDRLADRDACFELLRFELRRSRKTGDRLQLVRCVLSPAIDEARVVDDTLALLGILPARARSDADLEERWSAIARDENAHRGGFARVVPSIEAATIASELPLPRRSDLVLLERLGVSVSVDPRFSLRASVAFLGNKVVLFAPSTQRFHVPNDTAAYVWLRLEELAPLDMIASELHHQFGVPLAAARCDVWDIVARWAHEGLVRREDGVSPSDARESDHAADEDASANASASAPASTIAISGNAEDGFRVTSPWGSESEPRTEAQLAPLVRRLFAMAARRCAKGVVAISGVAVLPHRGAASGPTDAAASAHSVVIAGPEAFGGGGLAALLLARGYPVAASPVVLVDERSGAPLPLPLSLEISELDQRDVAAEHPELAAFASFTLPVEIEVKYLPFEAPNGPLPRVGAIVFMRRGVSGNVPALVKMEALAALQELTRQGLDASPPMTDEAATPFLAWLERTPCFELVTDGGLVSAADAVEALLSGPR